MEENGLNDSETVLKVEVVGKSEHKASNVNEVVYMFNYALKKPNAFLSLNIQHLVVDNVDNIVGVLILNNGTVLKVRVFVESRDGNDTCSRAGSSYYKSQSAGFKRCL